MNIVRIEDTHGIDIKKEYGEVDIDFSNHYGKTLQIQMAEKDYTRLRERMEEEE